MKNSSGESKEEEEELYSASMGAEEGSTGCNASKQES
jgi:hypothetical protein